MKRILTFALPILATFVVLGLGFLMVRTHTFSIKPKPGTFRDAVVEAVEEVVKHKEAHE